MSTQLLSKIVLVMFLKLSAHVTVVVEGRANSLLLCLDRNIINMFARAGHRLQKGLHVHRCSSLFRPSFCQVHTDNKSERSGIKPNLRIDTLLHDRNPKTFTVNRNATIEQAISHLVENKDSASLVIDENDKVIGLFTARDLLRFINKGVQGRYGNVLSRRIEEAMTPGHKVVRTSCAILLLIPCRIDYVCVMTDAMIIRCIAHPLIKLVDVVKSCFSYASATSLLFTMVKFWVINKHCLYKYGYVCTCIYHFLFYLNIVPSLSNHTLTKPTYWITYAACIGIILAKDLADSAFTVHATGGVYEES